MPQDHNKIPCGDFIVAGTSHRGLTQDQVNTLKKGAVIQFQREPTNQYDANAIICMAFIPPGQTHIGYVPAKIAKHLAPMIDNGVVLEGVVISTAPKLQISAGIYFMKALTFILDDDDDDEEGE